MKIYVAGKFEDRERVRELHGRLRQMGHKISYDWTNHKPISPYSQHQELAHVYSDNELSGILESDVFICLTHPEAVTTFMEFGEALALNKRTGKPIVYAVGEFVEKSPWFFNSAVRRRNTTDEVLEEIRRM